jgi:hypothetical protein
LSLDDVGFRAIAVHGNTSSALHGENVMFTFSSNFYNQTSYVIIHRLFSAHPGKHPGTRAYNTATAFLLPQE